MKRKPILVPEGMIFAADLFQIGGNEIPGEIDVLTEGTYTKRIRNLDGTTVAKEFTVKAADIDACAAHFAARRDRHPERDLVIDYEHQTLTGEEAPAAGWISAVHAIVRDGKKVLRAKISIWTDRAKAYLAAKEYRYISPVFALGSQDKETGQVEPCILLQAGLTNEPLIDGLQPIVSSFFNQLIAGKDTTMDELLERLRYFLNLPITATAEECAAELTKLLGQLKDATASTAETVTAKEVLIFCASAKDAIAARADLITVICAKDGATIEEAKATIISAKTGAAELVIAKARVLELEGKEFSREFDRIIAKAFSDGKILPVQKADAKWVESMQAFAAKDLGSFETYWQGQPVIAPITPIPEGPVAAKDGITEEDVAVAATMGVSKEQLLKHNKVD